MQAHPRMEGTGVAALCGEVQFYRSEACRGQGGAERSQLKQSERTAGDTSAPTAMRSNRQSGAEANQTDFGAPSRPTGAPCERAARPPQKDNAKRTKAGVLGDGRGAKEGETRPGHQLAGHQIKRPQRQLGHPLKNLWPVACKGTKWSVAERPLQASQWGNGREPTRYHFSRLYFGLQSKR